MLASVDKKLVAGCLHPLDINRKRRRGMNREGAGHRGRVNMKPLWGAAVMAVMAALLLPAASRAEPQNADTVPRPVFHQDFDRAGNAWLRGGLSQPFGRDSRNPAPPAAGHPRRRFDVQNHRMAGRNDSQTQRPRRAGRPVTSWCCRNLGNDPSAGRRAGWRLCWSGTALHVGRLWIHPDTKVSDVGSKTMMFAQRHRSDVEDCSVRFCDAFSVRV